MLVGYSYLDFTSGHVIGDVYLHRFATGDMGRNESLVDESISMVSHAVLWSCVGLLIAYVMAIITWYGRVRLVMSQVERCNVISCPTKHWTDQAKMLPFPRMWG